MSHLVILSVTPILPPHQAVQEMYLYWKLLQHLLAPLHPDSRCGLVCLMVTNEIQKAVHIGTQRFKTYIVASNQEAIKMLCLHFQGVLMSSFIQQHNITYLLIERHGCLSEIWHCHLSNAQQQGHWSWWNSSWDPEDWRG